MKLSGELPAGQHPVHAVVPSRSPPHLRPLPHDGSPLHPCSRDEGGHMTGSGGPTRRAGLRTMVAALAALPLLGVAGASAARRENASPGPLHPTPVPPLDVMTFNLRYASDEEPNSWSDRRPVMRTLLRRAA